MTMLRSLLGVAVRAMHIDPEQSWDRATAAITQQAAQLQALERDGTPLRPDDVEGGPEGVRYGYETMRPIQYGHGCIL